MVQRCDDPKRSGYGARGIKVCERWREFANFLADMGARPPGKTLDRWPNNDGNYEPGNCRWATPLQQAANRASTRNITVDGKTKCLYDWCRQYGLDPGTVRYRVRVLGWTEERAVTTPKMRRRFSKFEETTLA